MGAAAATPGNASSISITCFAGIDVLVIPKIGELPTGRTMMSAPTACMRPETSLSVPLVIPTISRTAITSMATAIIVIAARVLRWKILARTRLGMMVA